MVTGSERASFSPGVYETQRCPGCLREGVPFLQAVVERWRFGTETTVWYGCGYTWNARRQTMTVDPARGCGHLWPLTSVEP